MDKNDNSRSLEALKVTESLKELRVSNDKASVSEQDSFLEQNQKKSSLKAFSAKDEGNDQILQPKEVKTKNKRKKQAKENGVQGGSKREDFENDLEVLFLLVLSSFSSFSSTYPNYLFGFTFIHSRIRSSNQPMIVNTLANLAKHTQILIGKTEKIPFLMST